jgi:hypothetical protein
MFHCDVCGEIVEDDEMCSCEDSGYKDNPYGKNISPQDSEDYEDEFYDDEVTY